MNHLATTFLIILAISSLLTAETVLSDQADAAAAAQQQPASTEPTKCDRQDRQEKRAKHLETLKADLKLNASQEAAWTEWVGKIKGDHKNWEEKHKQFETWATLPAPERMEKMLAFSTKNVSPNKKRAWPPRRPFMRRCRLSSA
ncbi:MAG: hypothetical protein ACXWAT_07215 [Methylobacter sp.]